MALPPPPIPESVMPISRTNGGRFIVISKLPVMVHAENLPINIFFKWIGYFILMLKLHFLDNTILFLLLLILGLSIRVSVVGGITST